MDFNRLAGELLVGFKTSCLNHTPTCENGIWWWRANRELCAAVWRSWHYLLQMQKLNLAHVLRMGDSRPTKKQYKDSLGGEYCTTQLKRHYDSSSLV